MRRYYFDRILGDDIGEDDDGIDLPHVDAVQREALRVLAEMAQGLLQFPPSMAVEVRDDAGPVMRARAVFEIRRTN
jgi:hypothetical protein